MVRVTQFFAKRLAKLRGDEEGAALAEYAAIFIVIAIAGAAGLVLLGETIDEAFNAAAEWIDAEIVTRLQGE